MSQEIYIIDNNNEIEKNLKQIVKEEKDYIFKKANPDEMDIVLKYT